MRNSISGQMKARGIVKDSTARGRIVRRSGKQSGIVATDVATATTATSTTTSSSATYSTGAHVSTVVSRYGVVVIGVRV